MRKLSLSTFVAGLALAVVAALGLTTVNPSGAATSVTSAAAAPAAQADTIAKNAKGRMTSQVFGRSGRGTVRGTFVPLRFVKRGDGIAVRGIIHGVVRKPSGRQTFTAIRTLPVRSIGGQDVGAARDSSERRRCDILNLVLGPLDLDLLGLTVNLNRVVLDVVAVTGAGKLLGNLLCAITGLLDGNRLGRLTTLLNRVLAVLRLGL